MDLAPFDRSPSRASGEPIANRSATGPLRALLLLGMTLLSVTVLLASAAPNDDPATAIAPPPLPRVEAPCGAVGDAAGEHARRTEAAALARIARYPFAPADGLAADRLLDEAKHCYASSGDAAGQQRVATRAKLWRARLERDYRDHLIRYRRALAAARPELALHDIAFLLELLSRHDDPFLAQLRQAQREIEAFPQDRGRQ